MLKSLWLNHRRDVLFVAAALLLAGLLLGLQLNRFLTVVNHDAAIFCLLAQSLLDGHYMLMSEPNPQPYFTFPPFLSVQLAALMVLFQNFDPEAMQPIFKGYIGLLFLLTLPLFYHWLRGMLGQGHAMALTALLAVNPIIYRYVADILSDVPFWALSMGAIYAMWRRQRSFETGDGQSRRWTIAAVVLIILCALTRQIGMALILAFLLTLGLQRQWKAMALSVLAFAVTVGAWQSYEHFYRLEHPSTINSLNQQGVQEVLNKSPIKLEYVKHFLVDRPVNMDQNRMQTSPAVLLENVRLRFSRYAEISLDQVLYPIRMDGSYVTHHWPLMLLVVVPFVYGLVRLWQSFRFAALYLGISLGVLLVYPYISPRFLLPLFPIMLVCIYWGWRDLGRWLKNRHQAVWKKAGALVLPVFVLVAFTSHMIETVRRVKDGYDLKVADAGPSLRKGNSAYYHTLLWMKVHLPKDSLVVSRKPPVTYFYSGLRSTAYPFTSQSDELFAYIEEKQRLNPELKVYVFQDTVFGSSSSFLKPAVENHIERFRLVYTEPTTQSRVWELLPAGKK